MIHLRVALAIVLLSYTMAMPVPAQTVPDGDFGNPWMANLVELEPPPPVPWWPPAPGWYAIAVAVVLALGWLGWRGFSRRRAAAYRRKALRELEAIRRDGDLAALPELIRRTALAAYPRTRVAHLIGSEWLRFLDESADMTDFQQSVGSDLVDLSYAPAPPELLTADPILTAADRWIRRHKRTPGTEGGRA
jgi:hypothetical protein